MTELQSNRLSEMPKRYPTDGTFELTIRCNLHCKMCLFRHDDSENKELMENELNASEWIDLAKQVAESGTFNLLITGGEPLLRPDFCEIWEGVYKQGFLIELYTNATLVNDKVMETLRRYPPHRIGVTIYGSCPEVYEAVCGNAAAFDKMLKGAHKLMELPSEIQFRTTVIKDNYTDISNMEDLIRREFGENHLLQQPRSVIAAVRGGCCDVKNARLDPKDNIQLFFRRGIEKVESIVGKDKFDPRNIHISINTDKEAVSYRKRYTLLGCNAGMNSYTVSWDGKLLGCQLLDCFSVDIRKSGFQEAWDEFPFHVKLPPMNQKCMECTISEHCETCYAARLAETGDICGCPEYQCQDAHEIYKICKEGQL